MATGEPGDHSGFAAELPCVLHYSSDPVELSATPGRRPTRPLSATRQRRVEADSEPSPEPIGRRAARLVSEAPASQASVTPRTDIADRKSTRLNSSHLGIS